MEAVRLDNFSFTYAGASEAALIRASFSVDEGSFCVLVGDSGSGKTTLLRCLCPSLAPAGTRQGLVQIFGQDFRELSGYSGIGYVYQNPDAQMVCDKVYKELAFGLESIGMERDQMRRRVAELSSYFGLGSIFNRDCASLSGGQKQDVNVASVVAMNPRLLLLDELTSRLDPISARRLVELVAHINRAFKTTVILATHSPELFDGVATCAFEIKDRSVVPKSLDDLRLETKPKNPRYACDFPSKTNASLKSAISMDDITFAYSRDEANVIDRLSLDVQEGEIVSLVGANASGKSTLLKLVASILTPQRGSIRNSLSASCAYLPQDVKLLFSKDSVLEELMEWSRSAGYSVEDVHKIAKRFALVSMFDLNPFDLSCGQQQKLGLAKMLLCRPKLMLLDEPTTGLDGKSQIDIAKIIRRAANEGCTIVMASHDLAFASRVSNRMALLFDGEVACMQNSRSFCEGNLFYVPKVTLFTKMWDALYADEGRCTL